jgi:hypothetical protein
MGSGGSLTLWSPSNEAGGYGYVSMRLYRWCFIQLYRPISAGLFGLRLAGLTLMVGFSGFVKSEAFGNPFKHEQSY